MQERVQVIDDEPAEQKPRPNAPITTKTRDGREIAVTNRVFTLAEHPSNKSLLRSFSGTIYTRQPDGSLRVIEQAKLTKKEKSKLKRSLKKGANNEEQLDRA